MTIILIALSIFGIVLIAYGLFSKPKESLAGKILPDMIPWEMAGINVRSRLPDDEWNELALYAKRRQGFKCEVCGGHGKEQGFNHAVEAHEIWQHDHATRTQKLLGIVVLCPLCHKFKHIAFADSKGYGRQVRLTYRRSMAGLLTRWSWPSTEPPTRSSSFAVSGSWISPTSMTTPTRSEIGTSDPSSSPTKRTAIAVKGCTNEPLACPHYRLIAGLSVNLEVHPIHSFCGMGFVPFLPNRNLFQVAQLDSKIEAELDEIEELKRSKKREKSSDLLAFINSSCIYK